MQISQAAELVWRWPWNDLEMKNNSVECLNQILWNGRLRQGVYFCDIAMWKEVFDQILNSFTALNENGICCENLRKLWDFIGWKLINDVEWFYFLLADLL